MQLTSGAPTSAAAARLRLQIEGVGPHFRTASIRGDRGVRKEDVARSLHAASPAAERQFVVCDAARLEKLAQEGQTAGTGETVETLVRDARGGTLFVRELGRCSMEAQRMLLKVLDAADGQSGRRVRVIVSVSEDVPALIAAGLLRADLYARVGTIEIAVAPLRERKEEIAAIVLGMLNAVSTWEGTRSVEISAMALQQLEEREWPGNERELESAIRMALLNSGGSSIEEQHLPKRVVPAELRKEKSETVGPMKLQEVVDAHVQEVLRRCDGNKLKAAEVLGISRSTLYRMLDAALAMAV